MYDNADAGFWAAGASGGMTIAPLVGAQRWGLIAVQLSGGGYAGAILEGFTTGGAQTFYGRWYILAEAAQ